MKLKAYIILPLCVFIICVMIICEAITEDMSDLLDYIEEKART